MKTNNHYLEQARSVLTIEANALLDLANKLDEPFTLAINMLLACKGRVVVIGMGKSGHIGGKIAATLASTGTPAFFVHPGEAAHGDLGMILSEDIVIAISYSGESDEIIHILPALKRKGIKIIAITGRSESSLALASDIHLNSEIKNEACPLGLAPTTSTTAALALGDAIAVVLLNAHQFTSDDFALSHPAGSLGKKLLTHVCDLMHTKEELPSIPMGTKLQDALITMSEKGLGLTAVVDQNGLLKGIFTDGDLRRLFHTVTNLTDIVVDDVMGKSPHTITENKLATEALHIMEQKHISALLVVDESQLLIGVLHMHDLLKAGIV